MSRQISDGMCFQLGRDMKNFTKILLVVVVILSGLIGSVVGFSYYKNGVETFQERTTEEKNTILDLIGAFISSYGDLKNKSSNRENPSLPVPATFRANALEIFNKTRIGRGATEVEMVGIPGLAIKNAPKGENAIQMIKEMSDNHSDMIWSGHTVHNGIAVLQTIKPVIAKKESCVACHNTIQKDVKVWKTGDIIGAFVVNTPVGEVYEKIKFNALIWGLLAFLTTMILGLLLILVQNKRLKDANAQIEKEQILQEEMAQARQKAEEADRTKSEFLANMSHEIRTPMNGVMGMAELLTRTDLDAKQKSFADVIVKSGSALLTIINDILDFSKIGAGQLVLDPAPFELRDTVESVAALFSTHVDEKDLELAVRIDPELADMYVGDVGRLRQIITNLIGNAVKFTEHGSVFIGVTGNLIENNESEKLANIRFKIQDTGIGIPIDQQDKIFDKFSQVDESATREHEGTGLGLAISASLVQLMGSKINIESKVGKGSTFWFDIVLPVHGEVKPKQSVPADITGSRVFIVDDNQVNRTILTEQMLACQFDSAAAQSGLEALAVLRETVKRNIPVDAIILDYHMPQMNGGEVVHHIRNDSSLKHIPIIMLTSVNELKNGKTFSSLEIQAHLTKPAKSALLMETLINVLQNGKATNEDVDHCAQAARTISSFDGKKSKSSASLSTVTATVPEKIKNPDSSTDEIDVLLVEENEVNQIVIQQILEQEGLRYEVANNGAIGIEKYKEFKPSVILMDISMPVMNGLNATVAIRTLEDKTSSNTRTPIIGVTAHTLNGDMERCLDAGMDDYLSKPVSPKTLVKKINKWLDNKTENMMRA